MAVNVLIREAQPDDAAAVLLAMRQVLSEPIHHLNITLDEFDYTEDEERALITRISEADNSLILLAENLEHGEVVGFLTCRGDRRRARQHTTRLSIGIVADWRGQGVGRALMEHAIAWAQRHPSIRRVELDVLARNQAAIALYRKLGFQVEGRARGAVFKEGQYIDQLYMALMVPRKPTHST